MFSKPGVTPSGFDCRNGDDVDRLYRQVFPMVRTKLRYLSLQDEIAQEMLQEVFEKLIRKKMRFENIRHAYTYIYRSVHNRAVDYLRSGSCKAATDATHDFDAIAVPNSPEDRIANRELIVKAFFGMSRRDARIISYRFIDGLSLTEIEQLTGASERTIRRTVIKLQEQLLFSLKEVAFG